MESWIIGIACILLLCIVFYELFYNQKQYVEGFTEKQTYLEGFYPKRSDIVPGQTKEDNGWVRDLRYKEEYVDVQKIGLKHDLCRVVMRHDDPGSMIMACALAGTDGTPSRTYTTLSKAKGFVFSRDDYFRENKHSGRADYCRIKKIAQSPNDKWESYCTQGKIDMFSSKEVRDTEPPPKIIDLLWFYEGLMIWYRFKDDMLDYAQNTHIGLAGHVNIDQDPLLPTTEGLKINALTKIQQSNPPPAEQFLRIGENEELEFDDKVEIRNLRSFMFWAKFDQFTNNAHIFDFGNGAGHDNVYFGIEGTGNDTDTHKKKSLDNHPTDDDIVCQRAAPRELDPRVFMKYTEANVEIYDCPGPEPIAPATNIIDLKTEEIRNTFISGHEEPIPKKKANILFEIWDKEQRKMRIKCIDALEEGKLHHIACTVTDMSFRPTWKIYIDGVNIYTHQEGHLPQANYTTKNYIGRSNWEDEQSQYSDERFRGTLFDFRMYRVPLSEARIQKSIDWGSKIIKS